MKSSYRTFLSLGVIAVFIWSGAAPKDRFTWAMEVFPVVIGLPLLFWKRSVFPLTKLLYALLALHAIILCVGGRYTYAEVPFGFWMQSTFHFARNHYDRIGHFAQGFVPAILAREILLRKKAVKKEWLFYLVCSVCLAFSAFYELIEWWTAVLTGDAGTAFLGTQGDVWDTQWDMFWALAGAVTSLFAWSRIHDRQPAELEWHDLSRPQN
jgi:putative membrane protein